MTIQHRDILDWVAQFKQQQPLYRQTGATTSLGILLSNGSVLTIECLSFKTALLKLIGSLIKKHHDYAPIVFVSHGLVLDHAELLMALAPKLVLCQSAVTSNVVSFFKSHQVTLFGFCRKSKFNRYSNFHI